METDYTLKLLIEAQDKFSSTFESSISSLKKSIAWLWISLTALWTIKSVVNLADNLEQAQIAFETMLWSWEKATEMLQNLSEFAKKTPFELTWIRDSAKQLLAMWVNAQDIIPTLKSLWDVSAWLSVPLERLALNYWQVVAQWKLTWRELRDFTMAWVPLLDELSQMLWKTTTQIQDMISKWQITSNDVVQAFQNMSSEWWRFADLMWKQATTLSWMRSNFKDSLSLLWEEIWTELLPSLKEYTAQMWARLDDNIDTIKAVAIETINTAKVVADNIASLANDVWNIVLEVIWTLQETFDSLFNEILQSDTETANWIMWDRTDVFYFLQLWLTAVVSAVKLALKSSYAFLNAFWKSIWDIVWSIWSMFSALRDDVKNWAGNMATSAANSIIDLFNSILWWIESLADDIWIMTWIKINVNKLWPVNFWWWSTWALKAQIDSLKWALKENFDEMTSTIKTSFDESMNAVMNVYSNRLEKTTTQIVSDTNKAKDTISSFASSVWGITDLWDSIWWWSKWWKTKASEKVEEITEDMKALIKEMTEYWKETEKMKRSTYEWIVSSMEEAVKNAEKLSGEIDKLQNKISELNQSEKTDIAEQYVRAEERLKDMREEYEDIQRAVDKLWESYIMNDMWKDDTFFWMDRKTLREYIDLQEQLESAYSWLNEAQTQSLDEQIQKQREYNALNDIEKIKYDYEEKRKVIQDEIAEKKKAIETELTSYQELSTKKIEYEKERLDYLHYSYTEQQKMNSAIISQMQRIIDLKQQIWMWDISRRAWWWNVYWWSAYLVWENGPELFIPSQRWSIVPNNQITNNNWIEINMNWITVRSDSDIQQLADEIARRIKLEKDYWII